MLEVVDDVIKSQGVFRGVRNIIAKRTRPLTLHEFDAVSSRVVNRLQQNNDGLQLKGSVTIHQPHFLPWLPYIARLAASESFVVLDSVKFRRYYFHNRAYILQSQHKKIRLVLPVRHPIDTPIHETTLASTSAIRKIIRSIFYCYRKAPFFAPVWCELEGALLGLSNCSSLLEVNLQTIRSVFRILKLDLPTILLSSSITSETDRNTRVVDICSFLGKRVLLCGWGGARLQHDVELFVKHGIEPLFGRAGDVHQLMGGDCEPGISIVDSLMKKGPKDTRKAIIAIAKYYRELNG